MVRDTQQYQLALFDQSSRLTSGDLSFVHTGFCMSAFPLRRPTDESKPWSRWDQDFSISIQPAEFTIPGGQPVRIGVPYGPKPRVLMVWVSSQINDPLRRADDRWLEIRKIREWFSELQLPWGGRNVAETKDQLIRLSQARMTLSFRHGDQLPIRQETIFNTSVMPQDEFITYARGETREVPWPRELELSESVFSRFRQYAVPIPIDRLKPLTGNPMALDYFFYLCYRLPTLSVGESDIALWKDLARRFTPTLPAWRFKDKFLPSLRQAIDAYPEANIDVTAEGIVLRHSPPADLRRAFFPGFRPTILEGTPMS